MADPDHRRATGEADRVTRAHCLRWLTSQCTGSAGCQCFTAISPERQVPVRRDAGKRAAS